MRNHVVLALAAGLLAAGLAPAQTADAVPAPAAESPSPWWGEADFLAWRLKSDHTPPLVSVGPPGSGAILGRGGVPVFGGSVDEDPHFGGLFRLGYWFDCAQTVGVEGDYFFLATRTAHFTDGSNGAPGTPVIARPFFNVLSQAPDSELVAGPGGLAGVVGVGLSSRLQGAELDAVCRPCPDPCGDPCGGFRVEYLAGFRWVQLKEGLGIDENLQVLPGAAGIGGERFGVIDRFGTGDDFYGGQVGARADFRRGPWSLEVCGKLGLGDTRQTVNVVGATTIVPPGGPATTAAGGLLALPTNFGRHSRDEFGVVPEAGVTFGYRPVERVRLFVGYSFLYWSDVARPGNAIDVGVNPTRIPANLPVGAPFGPARPAFQFNGTDFWAQGIEVGAEFRY